MGLGNFTQYKSYKATPSTNQYVSFENPLTVQPKLILISCADDSAAMTSQQKLQCGVLDFGSVGAFGSINTNGIYISNGYLHDNGSDANARFGISNGFIRINRYSSAVYFDTSTEYTFDIYG